MLNTSHPNRSAGFTLIELIVTIVIIGILMSIAIPSFQGWFRNIQIRNAAESVATGLQRARAEAVSRNVNVSFTLTGTALTPGITTSWTLNEVATGTQIDSRASTEGSSNVYLQTLPVPTGGAPSTATVTYNNLGLLVANADGSATPTQINFGSIGGTKNLRITIGGVGNTKMCDPNLATGSSSRAC